jgi:hypothetical protein
MHKAGPPQLPTTPHVGRPPRPGAYLSPGTLPIRKPPKFRHCFGTVAVEAGGNHYASRDWTIVVCSHEECADLSRKGRVGPPHPSLDARGGFFRSRSSIAGSSARSAARVGRRCWTCRKSRTRCASLECRAPDEIIASNPLTCHGGATLKARICRDPVRRIAWN